LQAVAVRVDLDGAERPKQVRQRVLAEPKVVLGVGVVLVDETRREKTYAAGLEQAVDLVDSTLRCIEMLQDFGRKNGVEITGGPLDVVQVAAEVRRTGRVDVQGHILRRSEGLLVGRVLRSDV